jgi:hypothetical protein
MSKTFDEGREEVATLCRYFATNQSMFRAPGVKEAHIRQSLIDPLFIALGWDVGNTGMIAPQYREVVPEDALDVGGQQRAPDYTFRVGSVPKFYVEAKKCGVDISGDPAPAFQLRRYGWSAKMALSILTDFEELAVYDCTTRPRPGDKASHARVLYFGCQEYPERWNELWDIFSREAVWSGAFDQYAASKRKRGTSEVDVEFLKEIEGWRDALARNIALRNGDISSDDLNAAVQMTIDRIVFLRMAEDRGLESQEQLLKLSERPEIYPRFMRELCRKADAKYNSGLFHFQKEDGVAEAPDRVTPKLTIDDRVLKPILESLYFAHGSPYDFGVMPVELLGTVYERFLGKVIRLTAGHQAKIEEKPEVRKAGGVYYTPAYIVQYIVNETIGQQIKGQSPAQLAGGKVKPPLRVLDMACGSGSFLLGAYQCLLDHCLAWYVGHKPEKFKSAVYNGRRSGQWRLTIEEKKRILTAHIFGVDIDHQAVEVTKLSLLLKVLEGESAASVGRQMELFQQRALPNLAENIKCGNSLIGSDYFTGHLVSDPEEVRRVNPFDWQQGFPEAMKAGGFDAVVGNPPYGASTGDRDAAYLRAKYKSPANSLDTFLLFVERGHDLLRNSGLLGMIIPSGWVSTPSAMPLRRLFIDRFKPLAFVSLPFDVFQAYIDTVVVVARRVPAPEREANDAVRLVVFPHSFTVNTQSDFGQFEKSANYRDWLKSPRLEFLVTCSRDEAALLNKIRQQPHKLGDFVVVKRGIEAFSPQPRKVGLVNPKPAITAFQRYDLGHGKRGFVGYEPEIERSKPFEFFSSPRVLLRQVLSRKLRLQGIYTTDVFLTSQSVQSLIARADATAPVALPVLLAIINSRLMSWYFVNINSVARRDDFPKIIIQQTRELPVPDLAQHGEQASLIRLGVLVERIMELHRTDFATGSAARTEIWRRQIDATDAEIDRLVYDLYGLTAGEIAVVEGDAATAKRSE